MTAALAIVAPRVGQLIRLLGSNQNGEVLAAARALGRTLASIGEDFHTLAAIVEESDGLADSAADGNRPRPTDTDTDTDWRAVAEWLIDSGARLTEKERTFVLDMASWSGEPTERQEAWLRAIFERCSQRSRR